MVAISLRNRLFSLLLPARKEQNHSGARSIRRWNARVESGSNASAEEGLSECCGVVIAGTIVSAEAHNTKLALRSHPGNLRDEHKAVKIACAFSFRQIQNVGTSTIITLVRAQPTPAYRGHEQAEQCDATRAQSSVDDQRYRVRHGERESGRTPGLSHKAKTDVRVHCDTWGIFRRHGIGVVKVCPQDRSACQNVGRHRRKKGLVVAVKVQRRRDDLDFLFHSVTFRSPATCGGVDHRGFRTVECGH